MILLVQPCQPFLSPPLLRTEPNSSQRFTLSFTLLAFAHALSSIWDALCPPSFWKSSHLNLKTQLKDQTSGSLPLFLGWVSVLPGTPTAASGTSMNLFIPQYCGRLFPVCLTFWVGCSGKEGSQPVFVNQQTRSEKERCWGGQPALGLEAGGLSRCPDAPSSPVSTSVAPGKSCPLFEPRVFQL